MGAHTLVPREDGMRVHTDKAKTPHVARAPDSVKEVGCGSKTVLRYESRAPTSSSRSIGATLRSGVSLL